MTATTSRPAPAVELTGTPARSGVRVGVVAAVSAAVAIGAALLPAWPAGPDMGSTHYMGLLAANQPWNLLLFMAVPVVAAETIAVTELIILFTRGAYRRVNLVNKWVGIFAGLYFLGVFSYLLTHAVIPLTRDGGWRGTADLLAVGFYLLGLVPLYGMTLLETRVIGGRRDADGRLKLHATFVGIFLVVAHIAMIFGMLDPTVLGWDPQHTMPGGGSMPGMDM